MTDRRLASPDEWIARIRDGRAPFEQVVRNYADVYMFAATNLRGQSNLKGVRHRPSLTPIPLAVVLPSEEWR